MIVTNDAKVRLRGERRVIISVPPVDKGDVTYVQEYRSNSFRIEYAVFDVRPTDFAHANSVPLYVVNLLLCRDSS